MKLLIHLFVSLLFVQTLEAKPKTDFVYWENISELDKNIMIESALKYESIKKACEKNYIVLKQGFNYEDISDFLEILVCINKNEDEKIQPYLFYVFCKLIENAELVAVNSPDLRGNIGETGAQYFCNKTDYVINYCVQYKKPDFLFKCITELYSWTLYSPEYEDRKGLGYHLSWNNFVKKVKRNMVNSIPENTSYCDSLISQMRKEVFRK